MVLSNREKQARWRERLKERAAQLDTLLKEEIETSCDVLAQIDAGWRFATAEGNHELRDNTDEHRAFHEARIAKLAALLSDADPDGIPANLRGIQRTVTS